MGCDLAQGYYLGKPLPRYGRTKAVERGRFPVEALRGLREGSSYQEDPKRDILGAEPEA